MKFMIFFNHMEGVWDELDGAARARNQQALGKLITDLATEKKAKLIFFAPPGDARTVRQHPDGSQEVLTGGLKWSVPTGTRTTRWVLPDRSGFDG